MAEQMTSHPLLVGSLQNAVDQHAVPQQQLTQPQLTMFIAYLIIVAFWLLDTLTFYTGVDIFHRRRNTSFDTMTSCVVECNLKAETQENVTDINDSKSVPGMQFSTSNESLNHHKIALSENIKERKCQSLETEDSDGSKSSSPSTNDATKQNSKHAQEPSTVTLSKFISSMVLFGVIMTYFFLCDYAKIFTLGERVYSRDTFLFLVFIFFLVGCAFTIQPNPDKILNREQTEEWKGWMQVMFVWYHYFMAKEWYNWIRIYIACYVWMTGFGNFSFFWIRNDYSLWRVLKMLFRLNFLVLFVALTTNNEFMLYYICAMHTYWFISVYLFMKSFSSWNRNSVLMAVKFVVYAIVNAIIFDIPWMSYVVFRPFTFILGYHDRSLNVLHEWSFRAGLDHWACFFGMLCAYNYPHFEALMQYIDSKSVSKHERAKKATLRFSMIFACVFLSILWYSVFMGKDKLSYNSTHPYSSLIPITIFIVVRNIHPVVRSYHVHLFAWLGKITLETYLSQLHIYLLSNARMLLVFLVGYPLLNFSLTTLTYLLISHTLFTITNDCSNFLIPNDRKKLLKNVSFAVALFGVSAMLAYGTCAF